MTEHDAKLKALWLTRNRDASLPMVDEAALAAWLDGNLTGTEAEQVEAFLAESSEARAAVSALRLEGQPTPETASPELQTQLLETVLDRIENRRAQPAVIGRIGMQAAAAAAAIAVAALGFIFGRVAAPATNEAATDFVSVVTFDVLTDDDNMESFLLTTGLVSPIDPAAEGDQP